MIKIENNEILGVRRKNKNRNLSKVQTLYYKGDTVRFNMQNFWKIIIS